VSTVVSVQDHGYAIRWRDSADVVSSGDGTGDGSLLLVVGETFASKICGTSLRDLEDDGRFHVPGSLQSGIGSGRRGDVDCRDSKLLLLCVIEDLANVVASHNTSRNYIGETHDS